MRGKWQTCGLEACSFALSPLRSGLIGASAAQVTDIKSLRKCLTMLGGSDLLGASALLASEVPPIPSPRPPPPPHHAASCLSRLHCLACRRMSLPTRTLVRGNEGVRPCMRRQLFLYQFVAWHAKFGKQ